MPLNTTLQYDILVECKAMVKHAFASGLKVPANLVASLETYEQEHLRLISQSFDHSPENTEKNNVGTHQPHNYAHELSLIHNQLTDLISPAKPSTILLIETESQRCEWLKFLGPVPLIRQMMLVAIFALICFIALSLSSYVNGMPHNFSLLENSGISLLINELFLLSAAAIGASFAGLFQANHYIKRRTFDEIHGSSYWVRFVLGLLSGIILASLIPIETIETKSESPSSTLQGLGKPVLALLGGFSASLVYRILHRLASAIESIVHSDSKDNALIKENAAKNRINEKILTERMQLSSKLNTLQNMMSTQNQSPEAIVSEFQRIQQELINPDCHIPSLPDIPPKAVNQKANSTEQKQSTSSYKD